MHSRTHKRTLIILRPNPYMDTNYRNNNKKIQNKPQKPEAGAISMTRHDMLKINLITIH